jgi:uncharacterized membrane protein
MACKDCATRCVECEEFEMLISTEKDINVLKGIRKTLIQHRIKADDSLQGKVADWLTAKVGTMNCIILFMVLVSTPFVFPKTMELVQFVGGTYIPLVLMPLIMVAGNRTDKIRELRAERENRIQLVYDCIEELREEGHE